MYMNSGYLNNSHLHFKDKSKPLIVGSCGTYRLYKHPRLPTYRPRGRLDFQIIYVSAGSAYFHFDNAENDTVVTAGNMVLFRPKQFQKYEYYASEQTEVYWVHFTGGNVTNILRSYGIRDDMRVFYTGTSLEYERIFKRMISELQQCREDYQEMLVLLLKHLFILIHRHITKKHVLKNEYLEQEIDMAAQFFNDHYNADINIEEYARSRGMSVSWFIRNFKEYIGTTPMQYIVSIRITNAQALLETTTYSITEIGHIVGYENPLYFSRIFHKQKGFSPSEYRRKIKQKTGILQSDYVTE